MRQRAQLSETKVRNRTLPSRENSATWEIAIDAGSQVGAPPRSAPVLNDLEHPSLQTPIRRPPSFDHIPLRDFHSHFRVPLHVPDKQYKAFLQGQDGIQTTKPPLVTKEGCANICALFSGIACFFLFCVGVLLDRQPLYIKGVLLVQIVQDGSHRSKVQHVIPTTERLPAASSAYHAAIAYFLVVLACLYVTHPGWIQTKMKRRQMKYQEIPDLPRVATDLYDDSPVESAQPVAASWVWNVWSRVKVWVKQALAARGWYTPSKARRKRSAAKSAKSG